MATLLKILLGVAAVLAIALAANALVIERKTKPAEAADGGRLVEMLGGTLHIREDGPRRGKKVVLLHGWTASSRWWNRMTPLLTDRGYHVVRVDLLGHGGSAKPLEGYSMAEQADRVAKALKRLGIEDAMVVGHSTGGEVATSLAARYPEQARNLVVMDTEPDEDYTDIDLLAKLSVTTPVGQAAWLLSPSDAVEDGIGSAFVDDEVPVPDAFVEDLQGMTYSSYNETFDESASYVDDGDLEDDIKSVRMPVMIVFGAGDRLIDAEKSIEHYKRWLPKARTVVIRGAGHSPLWERPLQSTKALVSFDTKRAAARERRAARSRAGSTAEHAKARSPDERADARR